jgi:hypothetical protein
MVYKFANFKTHLPIPNDETEYYIEAIKWLIHLAKKQRGEVLHFNVGVDVKGNTWAYHFTYNVNFETFFLMHIERELIQLRTLNQ